MKKSELISLLEALPGDPEVILWNGLVEDYAEISPKLEQSFLVRRTLSYFIQTVENEEIRKRKDFDYRLPPKEIKALGKDYEKYNEWKDPQFVTEEDVEAGRYEKKPIVYIDAILRRKTTYGRMGSISY